MGWSKDPGPHSDGQDARHFFLQGIYERIKYIMIMVRQRLIIKIEHKTLSKTELTFFENERTLKKKYIKPVMDKEMK